jgi:hypothetical protein
MSKNKRAIIDVSFIRACPRDGKWLKNLIDEGTILVNNKKLFRIISY